MSFKRVPKHLYLVAVLGLIILTIVACGNEQTGNSSQQKTEVSSDKTENGQTKVRELVKVSSLRSGADAGIYLAKDLGYFEEQGIEIKIFEFKSSSEVIPLLGTGELDVGRAGINAGLFNAASQNVGIKVVADASSSPPGSKYVTWAVRKELFDNGTVKSIHDVKGKTIAVNGLNNSNEIDLENFLKLAGVKRDEVNVVTMGWGDMIPALANKGVDVVYLAEPSLTKALDSELATPLIGNGDVYPNHQFGIVQFSPNFIKNRPEVATKFMIAYLKAVRDYNKAFFVEQADVDLKNKLVEILSNNTSVKEKELWLKMNLTPIHPDGKLNIEGIMSDQDWYFDKGLVKQKVSIEDVIDTRFAKEAVQVIGQFR